jgi:hypothetical protein
MSEIVGFSFSYPPGRPVRGPREPASLRFRIEAVSDSLPSFGGAKCPVTQSPFGHFL